VPIFFDDENEIVELVFGEGDICVGAHYGLRKYQSQLTLTDIGQSCCIGQRLEEHLDDDAEDRKVTLTFPTTPEGLNGMRVVADRFFNALQGHYFNTIVCNLSQYVDKDDEQRVIREKIAGKSNRCLFCYKAEEDVKRLVSVFGVFLCNECIDQLHEAAHTESPMTFDQLITAYQQLHAETEQVQEKEAADDAE